MIKSVAKSLDIREAQELLAQIRFRVDDWRRLRDLDESNAAERSDVQFDAPKDPLALYVLSQHVGGWLPKGGWKLLQIDNSSALSADEGLLFDALLSAKYFTGADLQAQSLLFEFGSSDDVSKEIVIAHLIFLLLLFEQHGYVVSAGSDAGQMIAVQDGLVSISSRGSTDIGSGLEGLSKDQYRVPEWVLQIENLRRQ